MARFFLIAVMVAVAAITYIASPLWAAWSIREAIKAGDTAYLERKVDWPAVKVSLKESLNRLSSPLPQPSLDDPAPKASVWQRIKARFTRSAVDRLVENAASPERITQLATYKASYARHVAPRLRSPEPAEPQQSLTERAAQFWSRVKRAEFKTLGRFELEVADKDTPDRHFVGVLELRQLQWKLVEVRVHGVSEPPNTRRAVHRNAEPFDPGQER